MKIKHQKLSDIAKEIVKISYESLKTYKKNEEKYLEPLTALLDNGKTPADLIIQKWENEWQGNIKYLVDYSRLD